MDDAVAQPKPVATVARPDGFSGIPVLVNWKTNGSASNDARNGPNREESQEDVAESLKARKREHLPELKKEGGLEEHDGYVIAQR